MLTFTTSNELTKAFIREHLNDDVNKLLLRKNISPEVDLKFAVQQIEGRQKAKEKLPTLAACPDFIFPPRLSMEQCSSEHTAQYKSHLFEGKTVADITGGLGIDTYYISRKAQHVVYVEKNAELCAIAQHNFAALGAKNIEVRCEDGISFLQNTNQHFDAIYLDPARRDENKNKVVNLAECEPNILEHGNTLLNKAKFFVLKASPMLDITQAMRDLKEVSQIHVVAIKNDCKELIFTCQDAISDPLFYCSNIQQLSSQDFFFSAAEKKFSTAQYIASLKRYLYEPNVSILKAGAFNLLCTRFGVDKLHPDTHLYTSDELRSDFPGRIFEVEQTFALNTAELKKHLSEARANIAVRNFPLSVAEIRKRYKIQEGGEVFMFATTLYNGDKKIVKTRKLSQNADT